MLNLGKLTKLCKHLSYLRKLMVLKNILIKFLGSLFKNFSFMLCGDFNSIPNSAVYKYITDGELNCSTLDKRKVKLCLKNFLGFTANNGRYSIS